MFKHVLLPIDLNEEHSWKRALPIAIENCRGFEATLHLVTVVPDVGAHAAVAQFFPADYEDRVLDQMRKDLHAFSKDNVPEGVKVQHIIAHGTIYKEILEAAKRGEGRSDRHGRGPSRPGGLSAGAERGPGRPPCHLFGDGGSRLNEPTASPKYTAPRPDPGRGAAFRNEKCVT